MTFSVYFNSFRWSAVMSSVSPTISSISFLTFSFKYLHFKVNWVNKLVRSSHYLNFRMMYQSMHHQRQCCGSSVKSSKKEQNCCSNETQFKLLSCKDRGIMFLFHFIHENVNNIISSCPSIPANILHLDTKINKLNMVNI